MSAEPTRWRKHLLTALCVVVGGVAYGAVVMQSSSYLHFPEVIGKGGGTAISTSYDNHASIDEGAIGSSTSSSYRSDVGFMYLLGAQPWVQILTPPTPAIVGAGGSATVTWISNYSGTYTITQGTTTIVSGTVTGGTSVVSTLPASLLTPNALNNVFITVTATSPPAGATNPFAVATTVTDDRVAPTLSNFDMTQVTGSVNDPSITQLTIQIPSQPDQTIPVTGGTFTFSYPTGATQITVVGGAFQRIIRVLP